MNPLTNLSSPDKMKSISYVQKVPKPKKYRETDLESIGKYLNIGYALVIPILFGVIIGLFIDSWLGTTPWFTVGLIVFGAVLSIYNLFSLAQKEHERRRT